MSGTIYQLTAMKDADIRISAVYIDRKYIVFDNGVRLKIRWLNEDGKITDDIDEAVAYEFGNKQFGFGSTAFDISEFDELDKLEH